MSLEIYFPSLCQLVRQIMSTDLAVILQRFTGFSISDHLRITNRQIGLERSLRKKSQSYSPPSSSTNMDKVQFQSSLENVAGLKCSNETVSQVQKYHYIYGVVDIVESTDPLGGLPAITEVYFFRNMKVPYSATEMMENERRTDLKVCQKNEVKSKSCCL
ncbi:hypothetical protein CRENBAI_005450 [Crenichthys baileyi]|uniref:Uncharacterized protein n=1 Tax=Crenichthys baileyi TaxID=28760 RepID=A0AAV9S6G6_9TELE